MAGYLSLIAVLVSGVGLAQGVVTLMLALGGVTALIVVAKRWGHVVSDHLFSHSDQTLVLTVLGITFLVAGFAEEVGVGGCWGLPCRADALQARRPTGPPTCSARCATSSRRSSSPSSGCRSIRPGSLPSSGPRRCWRSPPGRPRSRRDGGAHGARVRTRGRFRAGAALIARRVLVAIAGIGVSGGEGEIASLASAYVLITAVAGPVVARVIDPIVQAVQSRSSVA